MKNQKLKILLEGTLMGALAAILSALIPPIAWFDLSLGLIPIIIYSLRRGWKAGLYAGFLWGVIPILIGRAYILTPMQGLLEYPIAHMGAGLAGLFALPCHQCIKNHQTAKLAKLLVLAVFVATFTKYLMHFIAGVIFWGAYAKWGLGPWMYSFVINGGSFVINFIVDSVILIALAQKSSQLFDPIHA